MNSFTLKNSTLLFSPFSAIQKHREVELLIALRMDRKIEDPSFLTCRGLFGSFCVAMSASGYTENSTDLELKSVCKTCSNIGHMTNSIFGFPSLFVEDFLEGFNRADCLSILDELNNKNWLQFEYKGVPVGKFASYEFFLNHKLSSIEIPVHLWEAFINHLQNCILTVEIGFNYFNVHRHKRVLVYNRLYSINRIFCHIAELHGVKTYSLQGAGPIGDYYSRISSLREDVDMFKLVRSPAWAAYSQTGMNFTNIRHATDHLRHLLRARSPWVYSTPAGKLSKKELRNQIGVKRSQKVFLLTTSSQDELLAASLTGVFTAPSENLLFRGSMEWIQFVAGQVRKHPEWFLIIRPHPREFPNKREGVSSESGAKLTSFLEQFENDSNIFINHSAQNLSIYDLAKITSVHLNSTSTVGLEMTLLGVPCLINSKSSLTGYPPEINYEASDKEEYVDYMNSLSKQVPLDFSRKAILWISFRYYKSTLRYRFTSNVLPYALGNFVRRLENRTKKFSFISIFLRSLVSFSILLGDFFRYQRRISLETEPKRKMAIGNNSKFSQLVNFKLFRIMSRKFR
jgi:hypothetical protein